MPYGQEPVEKNNSQYQVTKGRTEKKYIITYKGTMTLTNIRERYKDLYARGTISPVSNGKIFSISNVSVKNTGKTHTSPSGLYDLIFYEKLYSVTADVRYSYTTEWSTYKPNTSTWNVAWNSSNKSITPSVIESASRTNWIIKKKPNTSGNSGNNNSSNNSNNANNSNKVNQMIQSIQDSAKITGSNATKPAQNQTTFTPSNVSDKIIDCGQDSKKLYIRALYKRVLGKEPNNNQINEYYAKTIQQLSKDIIFCKESKEKNKIDKISNEEYTKALYRYILGREYDAGGLAAHVKGLNNGITRQNLIVSFINSQEFENKMKRKTNTINLNKKLCKAVYSYLKDNKYEIIKPSDTTITMYQSDIDKVKKLRINGKSIKDITGLSNFKNLQELSAFDNEINNLEELTKLPKLNVLNLNNNFTNIVNNDKNSKLSPIWKLTNLEELHLEKNGLKDTNTATGLGKLTKLKKLYLSNNQFNKITDIDKLTNLKELYLDNNEYVLDTYSNKNILDGTEKLSLEKVSMKNNQIKCIGILEKVNLPKVFVEAKDKNSRLYTVEDYECVNCKVENEEIIINNNAEEVTVKIKGGLADKTTCTYNNLRREIIIKDKVLANRLASKLKLIEPVKLQENGAYKIVVTDSLLNSIKNLDLSPTDNDKDKITDITGLEAFVNLESLDLNNNNVSNLNVLKDLKKLKTLTIRFNELTDLSGLKNVTSLVQLDVSNNKITDISGLSNLQGLTNVILSNNIIKNKLQPLSNLSKLSVLSISNNNTDDISSLGSNIKLDVFYASYNSIKDISVLNKDNLEFIELENNFIRLNIPDNIREIEIPDIVKLAIEKDGGLDNLELENCTIENNKIILEKYFYRAEIKIKTEKLSGTSINMQNSKFITRPQAEVSYNLSSDKKSMTVTITADKPLAHNNWGWNRIKENVYESVFKYNVKNHELVIKDLYGNSTRVLIDFDGVINEEIPGFTITYSKAISKEEASVIISSSEELHIFENDKYNIQVSKDRKHIKYTFTENVNLGQVVVLEKDYDPSVNYKEIGRYNSKIHITNIDTQEPKCTVEYNISGSTSNSVIATIWADEQVELENTKGKIIGKTIRDTDSGGTEYGTLIYYDNNTIETITVSDKALNTSKVDIEIENIDSNVNGLKVGTSGQEATNQNVTLNVKANENIKVQGNSDRQNAEKQKTRINALNKSIDKAGTRVASISYNDNIVKDLKFVSNNSLGLRETSNNISGSNESNEYSYEVTENLYGTVHVKDEAGNTDVSVFDASYIDKYAPQVVDREENENEDGSKLITLIINEEIICNDNLIGWTLSEDRKKITKLFKEDNTETLMLTDLAGNTTEYELEVSNIETIKYGIQVIEIDETDKYLVIIKTDKNLKEIEGWTLLEDGMSIAKVMNSDDEETVHIEDYDRNSSNVNIILPEAENKQIENEEDDKIDNTQSPVELPQTGKYTLVIELLIGVCIIIGVSMLLKYNNNKQIEK